MAAIDKTYFTSKEQYYEVKEWVKDRKFHLANWIKKYSEEQMDEAFNEGKELVLWNTPTFIDEYLIQCCKIPFIVERLKEQYGEFYNKIKNKQNYDTRRNNREISKPQC